MKLIFRGTCPHCETRGVSFANVGQHQFWSEGPDVLTVFTLVVCGYCDLAAMATFENSFDGRIDEDHLEESDVTLHPSAASKASVPEHLPDRVAQRYSEAVSNMRSAPESAAVMFRKTLELGLKTIRPDDDGNLYVRIEKAANAGAITRDLAEWAHRVRLDGNDAAHEDAVPTAKETRELRQFAELFLRYVFSLPGMTERWREELKRVRAAAHPQGQDNLGNDLPF